MKSILSEAAATANTSVAMRESQNRRGNLLQILSFSILLNKKGKRTYQIKKTNSSKHAIT